MAGLARLATVARIAEYGMLRGDGDDGIYFDQKPECDNEGFLLFDNYCYIQSLKRNH